MRLLLAVLAAAAALPFAGSCAMAAPGGAYPIHATVVGASPGMLVARTAGATGLLAAGTYRFAVDSPARGVRMGSEIDALVHGSRGGIPRLRDVALADPFVPGLPGALRVRALQTGDRLPNPLLVDQNGRRVHLGDWRGKTTVLSFVFTRCPDAKICPAISGKFAYLQRHIDPATTHLAIVTLDPVFDSPSVLRRYGVKFDTEASRWSLLTGEGHDVKALLDALRISPLQDGPGDFIHEESLVIADGDGIIRQIIPTPGWDPGDVLAYVRHLQGLASNPLQRLALAAVASIAAVCGGYGVAAILVEVGASLITFAIFGSILAWFFWRIFLADRAPSRPRS